MENMVLSLISTFTTTLRDVIPLPFDKGTEERYIARNEEENVFPSMNFYILDGKHTILAHKNIRN